MTDNSSGAKAPFEALTNSARHLSQLRIQVEQAQEQHTRLLREFLGAIECDSSQWEFEIIQQGKTIAKGPLNKQAQAILEALGASAARPGPGEGAGCPEKTGCTNIGQFGNKCFYLCHATHFG